MTRSHHDEFVADVLRTAFFSDPDQFLTDITVLGEQPVIELWNSVLSERDARGESTTVATGLSATLVNIGASQAFAMITLPHACHGEAMFAALVALQAGFRYLTLACSDDPDDTANRIGRLCEWTSIGPAIDPDVRVALSASELVSAVRRYVS